MAWIASPISVTREGSHAGVGSRRPKEMANKRVAIDALDDAAQRRVPALDGARASASCNTRRRSARSRSRGGGIGVSGATLPLTIM